MPNVSRPLGDVDVYREVLPSSHRNGEVARRWTGFGVEPATTAAGTARNGIVGDGHAHEFGLLPVSVAGKIHRFIGAIVAGHDELRLDDGGACPTHAFLVALAVRNRGYALVVHTCPTLYLAEIIAAGGAAAIEGRVTISGAVSPLARLIAKGGWLDFGIGSRTANEFAGRFRKRFARAVSFALE